MLRVYPKLNQHTAIQFADYVLQRLPFAVEVVQTDNGSEFGASFHWQGPGKVVSGIEDQPQHAGEICVAEIFGDAIRDGSADVGIGVKKLRDPALTQEFAAEPLEIDIAEFHTYGVDWRPGSLEFTVDGEVVRRLDQAPDYPMQLMIGVFDFPAKAGADDAGRHVPELVVSHVRGHPLD